MGLLSYFTSKIIKTKPRNNANAGEITIKSTGQKILMPVDMIWAFENGVYYEQNVSYFMDRLFEKYDNPVFIDVGANYGYYSVKYAHLCKHVISFEPVSQTNAVLESNISRNSLKNVSVYKLGLSNKQQELNINLYSSSGNNSIFQRNIPAEHPLKKIGEENIQLVALDDFIKESNLWGPDIIKIDVEGAELHVIEGGLMTIKNYKPAIIIEYSESTSLDAGYPKEALLEKLKSPDYSIWGIPDDSDDFRLIPEHAFGSEKISNLLILPSNVELF